MRLAIHQGPSSAGDAEAAFAALGRTLRAAAALGAEMAVFPELFLPGYNQGAAHADLAQPVDGPWAERVAGLARETGCGATLGFAEREGARLYNSALTIGSDGVRLGLYRKRQLFGPTETRLFTPGAAPCLFDLAGRRTALMICYDVEFAPLCREVAQAGAELVLVPTANMLPYTHVSRVIVPAQVASHRLSIAYASYSGVEGDLTYAGGSLVVGPDAEPLGSAGRGEAFIVVDLDAVGLIEPGRLSTQLADYRG